MKRVIRLEVDVPEDLPDLDWYDLGRAIAHFAGYPGTRAPRDLDWGEIEFVEWEENDE